MGPQSPVPPFTPAVPLQRPGRWKPRNQSQARCKIIKTQMWVREGEEGQRSQEGKQAVAQYSARMAGIQPGRGTWSWKRSGGKTLLQGLSTSW